MIEKAHAMGPPHIGKSHEYTNISLNRYVRHSLSDVTYFFTIDMKKIFNLDSLKHSDSIYEPHFVLKIKKNNF